MRTHTTRLTALFTCAGALALSASANTESTATIDAALFAMQTAPSSWTEAFAQGKGSIAFNYRYEEVDQDDFAKNAHASTLRTTVDFRTADYERVRAYIQFENTTIVGNEVYNDASGVSTSSRPVVADPAGSDLNQAYIDYDYDSGLVRLGRQELVFDNARFVGNVGWRQNHQSFDALTWMAGEDFPVDMTYAYVNNVNRIFGESGNKGNLRSDTHLLNVAKSFEDLGKLTVYAYALDLHAAAGLSTMTIGARFAGARDFGDAGTLDYQLEYANQSDYADNPASVDADYYRVELGGEFSGVKLGIGQELLGSDAGAVGFSTPLATLHAHNGWADVFLNTPANGLEDSFVRLSGKAGEINLLAVYHDFAADEGGADYGTELDLMAKYKLNANTVVGLKYADYSADSFAVDTQKIWFWLTWTP